MMEKNNKFRNDRSEIETKKIQKSRGLKNRNQIPFSSTFFSQNYQLFRYPLQKWRNQWMKSSKDFFLTEERKITKQTNPLHLCQNSGNDMHKRKYPYFLLRFIFHRFYSKNRIWNVSVLCVCCFIILFHISLHDFFYLN